MSAYKKNSLQDKLKLFCRFSSILITVLGFLFLMGWILNIPILIAPGPTYATIALPTTINFILIGISIYILQKKQISLQSRTVVQLLSILVLLAGLISLIFYILNYVLQIDLFGILFGPQNTSVYGMSIIAALSFILTGIALLIIDTSICKKRNFCQYLMIITFFLMYLTILGYIYQTTIYNIPNIIQPSIYGTITFIIVSMSILCARPDRGPMGLLSSNRLSGILGRRILPAIIVLPLIIGELRLLGEKLELYDSNFGIAITIFSTTLLLFIIALIGLNSNDNTDLKRLKAEQRLRRSNDELRQFAYITSHDLQEPLRTIASYAGLLKRRYEGQLDSDADEFIGYMVSGASRMKSMIQGLIEYSRVGTGKEKFIEFSTKNALKNAISSLKSSIDESNAEITYEELPYITGNESQISIVFHNLIENALKFQKEGVPPKIKISFKKRGNEYVFSISDNGIGLEEQYSDKIFEVFKRLHTIDKYQGAGIGLAIIKRIIEQHGGYVWVKSELWKGSTFYFTIPIQNINDESY
ncbi:sensor histidine kinase [Methanobacterium sp. ACI-7]|uniref:sensor histidine kinase n=1 Tax=unclassified Methanobacterium TaxID=2627676 RepID=UPI0039C066C6